MLSRCFRIILGVVVVAWTADVAAREPMPLNNGATADVSSSPSLSMYDAYVADPADSSVVEVPAADSSFAVGAPIAWEKSDENAAERIERKAETQPELYCLEHHQAVIGSGRSQTVYGTACQRSDGSLLIVAASPGNARVSYIAAAARDPSQYCREYQENIDSNGQSQAAYGTACWQPDGSWRIVAPAKTTGVAVATAAPAVFQTPAYQTDSSQTDSSWGGGAPNYAGPSVVQGLAVPTPPASTYQANISQPPVSQPGASRTTAQPTWAAATALAAVATVATAIERVAEVRSDNRNYRTAAPRTPILRASSPRMSTALRTSRAKAPALSRWIHTPAPKRVSVKRKSH